MSSEINWEDAYRRALVRGGCTEEAAAIRAAEEWPRIEQQITEEALVIRASLIAEGYDVE